MRRTLLRGAVLFAAAALAAVTGLRVVSAHDVHDYGKLKLALGWLNEPAYVGQPNAVQVLVKDAAGSPITAITDKDLTVDVSVNGQTLGGKQLKPTADPDTGLGSPGEYQYSLIPTSPGAYTFHLKGSVAGTPVDETVTAGDKTFAEVTSASDAQFPQQQPSSTDLSNKLDRLGSRIDSANDAANRAQVLAIVGIGVALLLGATALVLAMRRGRTKA